MYEKDKGASGITASCSLAMPSEANRPPKRSAPLDILYIFPRPKVSTNLTMSELTAAEDLKINLAITPKTVSLLLRAGYKSHKDLVIVTPNQLLQQIADGLGTTVRGADGYRRACRRMVWLGTQGDPVEAAKANLDWTQKRLKQRRVWCDGYDDLTGEEIEARFRAVVQEQGSVASEAV